MSSSPHLAIAAAAPPHPRRLPPPCWSHDETAALIDAYRDKWYSLRRGNLRAGHWEEVAESVASRCPPPSLSTSAPSLLLPKKTPVQCRHKMEKLRKRYRNDLNRSLARAGPGQAPVSSWVHFGRMHAMERGDGSGLIVASPAALGFDRPCPEEDNDDDEELYQSIRHGSKPGIRIKIPSDSTKFGGGFVGATRVVGNGFASPGFGTSATKVVGNGYEERSGGKRRREKGGEGVAAALRALGDGYVRVEKMKMEMAREVEAMRMEMEMKRTEMILEAQQRIVQAFASAVSEKKNNKG